MKLMRGSESQVAHRSKPEPGRGCPAGADLGGVWAADVWWPRWATPALSLGCAFLFSTASGTEKPLDKYVLKERKRGVGG